MTIFYVIATLCLILGLVLYLKFDQVSIFEFIGVGVVAFMLSGIFHYISFSSMTADTEIWSGRIISVIHHPKWVERVKRTRTDSDGKTHTTVSYQTHKEYWEAKTNIDSSERISEELFNQFSAKFGPIVPTRAYKSGFHSGDRNIYVCDNVSGYMIPISENRSFENRIKGSRTVWDYPEVPAGTPVFEYPVTKNWFSSSRLLGAAKSSISLDKFDGMCARVGSSMQANVVIVGFDDNSTIEMGHHQESKWIGGKKNDIVICYGGGTPQDPSWVHVFSWTEKENCKINIRNIFMDNTINDDILSFLEKEIKSTFVRKNFSDFDYIGISPPPWAFPWYIGVVSVFQIGVWVFFFMNGYGKREDGFSFGKRPRYY